MIRRFFLILLLALLTGVYFSDRIIGFFLRPVLERTLTRVFGMPVQMDALKANLVTGESESLGIQFMNQPGYSYAPHLYAKRMSFVIDFRELLKKRVVIQYVVLEQVFYLIEARLREGQRRTNITEWIRNIRERNARRKEALGEEYKPTSWKVDISSILIRNGVFIYDDHTVSDVSNRFVFHHLEGHMSGFKWPSEDPLDLRQTLNLRGLIGEQFPAPVQVNGSANFATKQVSFDLQGRIQGGTMSEYSRFWSDLPIVIQQGNFDLQIRMICERKEVKSDSLLRLYNLKVATGPSASEFIWGLPVAGALGFLQNEKEILLKVPVSGDITDPKFYFYKAFGEAFQDSFKQKLQSGARVLTQAPVAFVVQAPAVIVEQARAVVQAPERLAIQIANRREKNRENQDNQIEEKESEL